MDPAKLMEVSLEGDFKDSITRKRWLGRPRDNRLTNQYHTYDFTEKTCTIFVRNSRIAEQSAKTSIDLIA